ncbi:MAG: hypothetical protein ACTSQY_03720 [Candidatus Odinarchaeia archaeon]
MSENNNLDEKIEFLRNSLFNLYTMIFSKVINEFGGDAAQILSKEKDEALGRLIDQIKKSSIQEQSGENSIYEFYEKYLPLLGFKSELAQLNDEVLFLKITKCPIMDIGQKTSTSPLCNLICLPASEIITKKFNPNYNIEIIESKWEGEEFCKIHIKKPPEMMSLEEVLDRITDLKPVNCPYRHVDTPCVFCDDVDCEKCNYQEFRLANGLARKCVNSAVLNLSLPLKDELDVYILRKLTNRFGEDGVFRVMQKPEQGYNLSFFFMSKTGENRDKVKGILLAFLENIKGILSEGRVAINNWVEKKRSGLIKTFKEEGKIPQKIIRIVECPYCQTKIRFTMDGNYFDSVEEYPTSFAIQHGDHTFKVYIDEDLSIVKIEKGDTEE